MLAKIEQLLQEIEGLQAANAEELEALRIKYLSKKGAINELMADFRNVPAEQKKEVGMKLNELKNKAQERIATLKEVFETQDNGAAKTALPATNASAPASTKRAPVSRFTPPSTSISAFEPVRSIRARSSRTFSTECSINFCPPNPGFTLMISTYIHPG